MKVQLKEKYGFIRDEGETQNFFGVPFTCKNKKLSDDKFVSEWFADIDAKQAKEMEAAGRVDIKGKVTDG